MIAMLLSAPLVLLSLLPVSETVAVVASIVIPTVLILLSIYAAPVIRINDKLSVNKINVPLSALGEALIVPEDQIRFERGPGLSPGSQFVIRGDVKYLVRVPVDDPQDPTSYLLLSTRKPEELAGALNANRA